MLSVCCLSSRAYSGGYEISSVFKDYVSSPQGQYAAVVRLDNGKLSVDTSRFSGEKTSLLYSNGDPVIRHLYYARHEYSEFNEQSMGKAMDSVQSALDYMREKLSMAKQAQAVGDMAPQIKKDKGGWTLQGLSCQRYQVSYGTLLRQEVWVAEWSHVKMSPGDFQALKQLAAAYDRLMKSADMMAALDFMAYIPIKGINQIDGYPLLIKQYSQGALNYEIQLERPRPKQYSASIFEIPQDFKKTWF